MSHPFALNLSDLKALEIQQEQLTEEEADRVRGGDRIQCITDPCPGSGDHWPPIHKKPPYLGPPIKYPNFPKYFPKPPHGKPPKVTTLALGEEGGGYTTLALGEEGGGYVW